jgi:hypothetical protein
MRLDPYDVLDGLMFLALVMIMLMPISAARAMLPTKPAERPWDPGSSSIAFPDIIPTAFVGEWAPDAAECRDSERTSGLYVRPEGVDTYETGARLERITRAGPERMRLSYEGEGSLWDALEVWALNADHTQLVIRDETDKAKPTTRKLVRCK